MRARIGVILLIFACSGKNAGPAAEDDESALIDEVPVPAGAPLPGGLCEDEGDATCVQSPEGSGLIRCDAGIWTLIDLCAEKCLAADKCSSGCAVVGGEAACLCAPSGTSCETVSFCASHDLLYDTTSGPADGVFCPEFCAGDNGEGFSVGCGYSPEEAKSSCLCATAGDPCMGARDFCTGVPAGPYGATFTTLEIARCTDGAWIVESCSEVCEDDLALCYRQEDGDACSCSLR